MNPLLKNAETGLKPVFAIILTALFLFSCSGNHLINSIEYRILTENAFIKRKQLAVERDSALFTVFNLHLSKNQEEALKYLYAYMPLSDLADYNGDFFLANINISLKAKSETEWGKEIPDEIFLHYVLPCRINNENLDSFRLIYYNELMHRVKGEGIKEAALEINHWCHEKVNYQPSDERTSAPMSTILSARGRCGEESTLTVAALRTVGIPARQVYTPRWAHTDDNHAWVEIWADGQWYYMGACEPEPVLDYGWFTEPARRAMLVHTKSFGAFSGNENVINRYDNYTDVNNLAKYAVTKKIYVKVLDMDNLPVDDAHVEYQLYNYAEFYPLADVPTNKDGLSQFETGLGDLLIWAHKGDDFDFRKISVAETDTLIMKLGRQEVTGTSINLDLDVPIVRKPFPGPSQELIAANSARINKENTIRQKYIDSWMKPSEAKKLAIKLKIDTGRVMNIIARSMGNYKEISLFLSETPDSLRPDAMSLLDIISDKDLRDTRNYILSDHLRNCALLLKSHEEYDNRIFIEYILNPRVANEMLVPWRHYFLKALPSELQTGALHDPSLIVQYLNNNIRIADAENYYQTPLTPVGVNELKVSDKASRAICFVAICRSLGIPSRLEPGRNVPQYLFNNKWIDVYFSDHKQADQNKGFIKFQSTDTKPVPEYYIQFTLARFENGRYNTLEYDYNKKISDFKEELPLPPGHYMLVTGNRLNDSKILANISFFDLAENEHKTIAVKIRKDVTEKKVLGTVDIKAILNLSLNTALPMSCTKDKGYVIIWVDPEQEPSRHIFNDLPVLKTEFDAWGGQFIFLWGGMNGDNSPQQNGNSFNPGANKGLPVNTSFGVDENMLFLKKIIKSNFPEEKNLPFVVLTDKDGNIYFISAGYRIGIGEQILRYIR